VRKKSDINSQDSHFERITQEQRIFLGQKRRGREKERSIE
jgi:hypothetical protein